MAKKKRDTFYESQYVCGLCKVEVNDAVSVTSYSRANCLMFVRKISQGSAVDGIVPAVLHECKDGGVGVAQFVGFAAVDANERVRESLRTGDDNRAKVSVPGAKNKSTSVKPVD